MPRPNPQQTNKSHKKTVLNSNVPTPAISVFCQNVSRQPFFMYFPQRVIRSSEILRELPYKI